MVDIPSHPRRGFQIDVIRKRRGLLREVNEQIRRTSASFGAEAESYLMLCECEDADCLQRIEVPTGVYEEIRRDRERFLVVGGHEDRDVEPVLASDGYCVVRVRTAATGDAAPSPLPAA